MTTPPHLCHTCDCIAYHPVGAPCNCHCHGVNPPRAPGEQAEQLTDHILDTLAHAHENFKERDFLIHLLTQALLSAHTHGQQVGREECIKATEVLDPLLAKCDWEQSDEIAYAVKKLIVDTLRALPVARREGG